MEWSGSQREDRLSIAEDCLTEIASLRLGDILSEITLKSAEYRGDTPHHERASMTHAGGKRLVVPTKGLARSFQQPGACQAILELIVTESEGSDAS